MPHKRRPTLLKDGLVHCLCLVSCFNPLKFFMYTYVSLWVYVCAGTCTCEFTQRPKKDLRSFRPGVIYVSWISDLLHVPWDVNSGPNDYETSAFNHWAFHSALLASIWCLIYIRAYCSFFGISCPSGDTHHLRFTIIFFHSRRNIFDLLISVSNVLKTLLSELKTTDQLH